MDSDRNEGKDYFEINRETGEIFTKVMFDREKQGAYALEVEARDGAPSARPNSNGQPNSGMSTPSFSNFSACFRSSFNRSQNLLGRRKKENSRIVFSCISEEKDRMNFRIFCRFGHKMGAYLMLVSKRYDNNTIILGRIRFSMVSSNVKFEKSIVSLTSSF